MTLPPGQPNPLRAAYLRVERGREHLAELSDLCEEICELFDSELEEHFGGRKVTMPIEAFTARIDAPLRDPQDRMPDKVPILVGETAYNFRAALDYLVGRLSLLDTPVMDTVRDRKNQFPVDRTVKVFASRRNTWLLGLNDDHVRAIERYQPYNGVSWTAQLARLSNIDKHNDLITARQGFQLVFHEPETETAGVPRKVEITTMVMIEFEKHWPLLPTLEQLGDHVTEVLDCFSGDFTQLESGNSTTSA